jgi:hexosaminidase
MQKISLFTLLFTTFARLDAQISIIPQPVSATFTRDLPFQLTAKSTIGGNTTEARRIATVFSQKIKPATSFSLPVQTKGDIQFNLNVKLDTLLGQEGYALEVRAQGIEIKANQPAGLYYGYQTLMQLLPKSIESQQVIKSEWAIPACAITDYPRFKWRGLMLDVSRHFFTKDEVKKYIDHAARNKYNIFHWHLTDDQGWRIEIKSLPKLTQIGGCRVPRAGKWGTYDAPKPNEAATDCGYYTQKDIQEIVAYAAEQYVHIVPEIDVPGHSTAAIAAYPELSCTKDTNIRVSCGNNFAEWYGNGKFKMLIDNSLNPSDEKVYGFLDKVFTEVAQLFPFAYIHAGGDECYHGYWENDAGCQALMKREKLKDMAEVQSYFTKRVEKIIRSKGKKLLGWDEILEGGLAPEAAVMSWRGYQGGSEAAKQGHEVVMAPNDFVYTDLLQGDLAVEPDQTAYKKVRLKKSYEFEPAPDSINPKYILGGQACLWTEKVPTFRQVEYMSFPRVWALSDIYWSPKGTKNWTNFISRMEKAMERADIAGWNYAKSVYDAMITPVKKDGKIEVTIATEIEGLDIFYTLNETLPDAYSTRYTGAISIPTANELTLKVITYRAGKPVGKMIALSKEELTKRAQ